MSNHLQHENLQAPEDFCPQLLVFSVLMLIMLSLFDYYADREEAAQAFPSICKSFA
jgi:hypothetical protein